MNTRTNESSTSCNGPRRMSLSGGGGILEFLKGRALCATSSVDPLGLRPWMPVMAMLASASLASAQPPPPPPPHCFRAGTCDCFEAPVEATHVSPELSDYGTNIHGFGPVGFDDLQIDHWFGYSFTGLPTGIVSATLTITARPNASTLSTNDAIHIGRLSGSGANTNWTSLSSYYFGPSGAPTLFSADWDQTNFPPTGCGGTVSITLPAAVIATMNGDALDIYVQDDTSIDCIGLQLTIGCYGNCDNSTAIPVLTANDFQCFLNAFASGESYANCDQSTTPPVLTANDFQCFLNAFAAGCS